MGSSCIEVVQDELIKGIGFGYSLIEIKIIIQPALPQSSFIFEVIFKINLGFKGLALTILLNVLLWTLLCIMKASDRFPSYPYMKSLVKSL